MRYGFKEWAKVQAKKLFGKVAFGVLSLLPLEDKVVFCNFNGKCYGDNPRYISEALHRLHPEVRQIWLEHAGFHIAPPEYAEVVRWPSGRMFRELATAKAWVDSHSKPLYVWKRKGQFYLETWHGGLGMKKIEGDAEETLSYDYMQTSRHNTELADVFASNCGWLNDIYRRAFRYRGEIVQSGYPKNDIFFSGEQREISRKVREKLGLAETDRIFLYAPTFREYDPGLGWLDLDFDRVHRALTEQTGEAWTMLVKLHPRMIGESATVQWGDCVRDVTDYPDMQELILATDLFVTDYSSSIFDHCLMKKPGFLYASDYAAYEAHERGLYFDLRELPFPFAETTDALVENIASFDPEAYSQALDAFFERVDLTERGGAAEQLAELVFTRMTF